MRRCGIGAALSALLLWPGCGGGSVRPVPLDQLGSDLAAGQGTCGPSTKCNGV